MPPDDSAKQEKINLEKPIDTISEFLTFREPINRSIDNDAKDGSWLLE